MSHHPPRPTSPRDLALLRLDRARLPGWRSNLISRPPPDTEPSPRDAALVEVLYVGCVKSLFPLRHRVSHHAGKPLHAIDELVQKILVLAAWQLTGMDNIPPAIAVDQAVEQCRRFARRSAAPLVNAVLRNFARQPPPPPPSDDLPLPQLWELRHGIPAALTLALLAEFGTATAQAIAAHANLTPPLLLRLFPGVTIDDLSAALAPLDSPPALLPHTQLGMVVAQHARRDHLAALARAGLAQVQDATAAAALDLADLRPGQTVLDRCAGSGTKTLHMQSLVGPTGAVHAVEPNPHRCQQLSSLAAARNISNLTVHTASTLAAAHLSTPQCFDRILLDVPCSNSGVLARRPEARFAPPPSSQSPSHRSLQKLQLDLLDDTAPALRTGGLLIYSTCSIWKSENSLQVRQFLSTHPHFILQAEHQHLPTASSNTPDTYRDGGYTASMLRVR